MSAEVYSVNFQADRISVEMLNDFMTNTSDFDFVTVRFCACIFSLYIYSKSN